MLTKRPIRSRLRSISFSYNGVASLVVSAGMKSLALQTSTASDIGSRRIWGKSERALTTIMPEKDVLACEISKVVYCWKHVIKFGFLIHPDPWLAVEVRNLTRKNWNLRFEADKNIRYVNRQKGDSRGQKSAGSSKLMPDKVIRSIFV